MGNKRSGMRFLAMWGYLRKFALSIAAIRHKRLLSFLIGFLLLFAFFLYNNVTAFYHDTNGYWIMSHLFVKDGAFTFNLAGHASTDIEVTLTKFRGYCLPFLFFLLRCGQQSFPLYWLLYSAFISFLFTCVGGDLFERIFGKTANTFQRLVPIILVLIFWHGLVYYPTSDLTAVLLCFLSLFILMQIENKANTRPIKLFALSLAYGATLYVTYNVRPNYLLNIPLGIIAFLVLVFRKKRNLAAASTIFVLAGIILVSVPQVQINYTNFHFLSPQNPLALNANADKDISGILYEGLVIDRYETSVSAETDKAALINTNSVGTSILNNEAAKNHITRTTFEYLKLVIRYPLEFLGIYASHFANAIDSRYGELYIKNLSGRRYISIILNYICFFLSLTGCALLLKKKAYTDGAPNTKSKQSYFQTNAEVGNFMTFCKKSGFVTIQSSKLSQKKACQQEHF